MITTQNDGQLLRPDTAMLYPSPTNPRKTFAAEALQELADSIRQHGILQPIVVREMSDDMRQRLGTDCRLEIVAGERRWRAACLAGLQTVPVLLRDLTDAQVFSLQIIENLQREGLSAIEEAEGFGQLQSNGMTGPQIAAQVCRSISYVYAKLKLLALRPEAREAVRNGTLIESIAVLIARIPVAALQLDALAVATQRDEYTSELPSFRRVKTHITTAYTRNLAKAPFDINDASLTDCGACTACPHNLANQNDGTANVCTNPPCFDDKRNAHNVRALDLPPETPRIEIPRSPGSIGGPTNWTDYDAAGYRLLSGINHGEGRAPAEQRSYADWLKAYGESVPLAVHIDPFTSDARIIASKADLIAAAERIAQAKAAETPEPITEPTETPSPTPQASTAAKAPPEQPVAKKEAPQQSATEAAQLAAVQARAQSEWAQAQALQSEICQNPPLLITWPITKLIAEYMLDTKIDEEETESDCIAYIVKTLSQRAKALGLPELITLAKSLNIDIEHIQQQHPIPAATDSTVTNNPHTRYRHPENPAICWSGKGRKPQWVTEWLANGGDISDLGA